uniref:Uncharacterized protein n=1 Tax=Anopheles funestus TaxID=62324 RepID=A0A182S267_ANOFN
MRESNRRNAIKQKLKTQHVNDERIAMEKGRQDKCMHTANNGVLG